MVGEEWEAGHELNRLVLGELDIPKERIEYHLDRIRSRKEIAVEEAIFRRTAKTAMPKKN